MKNKFNSKINLKSNVLKVLTGALLLLSFSAANAWIIFPDAHSGWGNWCAHCWANRVGAGHDHGTEKVTPFSGTATKKMLEAYAQAHEKHTGEKTLIVKDREEFNKLMAQKSNNSAAK